MDDSASPSSTLKIDGPLTSSRSSWVFDERVAPVFDSHVRKSVPDYEHVQRLAVQLSDWFVYEGCTVIDLGASTGETIRRLQERHASKGVRCIGYDNSPAMIEQARLKGVAIERATLPVEPSNFPSHSFAVSLYTLQFLRPEARWTTIHKLARGMEEGGGAFIVEKVVADQPGTFDIIQSLYWDFKRESGLTPEEVIGKANALRGAMFPQTTKQNESLLRGCFREVECVFRSLAFAGWLCIK